MCVGFINNPYPYQQSINSSISIPHVFIFYMLVIPAKLTGQPSKCIAIYSMNRTPHSILGGEMEFLGRLLGAQSTNYMNKKAGE